MLMQFLGDLAQIDFRLLFLGLFVLLLLASEAGYRLGRRARQARMRRAAHAQSHEPAAEKDSVGFVTAGMLGLLAFLLGVSLSMGQSRYDSRRDVVRDEANAIGTAWLRAEFAGPERGAELRRLIEDYTRLRIDAVRHPLDAARGRDSWNQAAALQARMWALGSAVTRARPDQNTALLIVALNEMFDLSLSSRRDFSDRIPVGVLRMLLWATIITVGVVGFNFGLGGSRQPVIAALLLVFWSSGLVLIVDLNQPDHGAVMVSVAPLAWTLEGFGQVAPLLPDDPLAGPDQTR